MDEAGASKLLSILEQNRDLANEVASAFQTAASAIDGFGKAVSGEENTPLIRSSGTGSADGTPGAVRDGFWFSDSPMQDLARLQLGGVLKGENAPAVPRNARELTLANLETMFLGQASLDAASAGKELFSWKDIGLASDPSRREGYAELMDAATGLIREPMAQARDYMRQAMEAEEAGQSGAEYIQLVDEVLRKPLEQVRDMVDSFDFGDESASSEGGRSGAEGQEMTGEMDLTDAEKDLDAFRKDASEPVSLSADASGVVSAGQSAYDSIKNIFATPITVKAEADTSSVSSGGGGGGGGSTTVAKMSSGGRFSHPTRVEVAEDGGTEYIIPVRREGRAVPLLRQLLSELSPGARNSLLGGGKGPSLSGFGSLASPSAGMTQNNKNVSAPVTINVRAAGGDPERIGRSVYDAAERYLLRAIGNE